MSQFSRRHYKMLAQVLGTTLAYGHNTGIERLGVRLEAMFVQDNPRFRPSIWREAVREATEAETHIIGG